LRDATQVNGTNVGFGVAPTPYGAGVNQLAVGGSVQPVIDLFIGATRNALYSVNASTMYFGTVVNKPIKIWTNSIERMHLAEYGPSLGLGGTPNSYGSSDAGFTINGSATSSLDFNIGGTIISTIRQSGAGSLLLGTTAARNIDFIIDSAVRLQLQGASLIPGSDNSTTLGSASRRWSTVYAGTGTINTSDAREKTAVSALFASEIAAAKALAKEIGTYRFLQAVAEKGDGARLHIGMTVQKAISIMESNGLDPMRYGFICYDEWEEVRTPAQVEIREEPTGLVDSEGAPIMRQIEVEIAPEKVNPAGSRFAFRPDEFLMFLARGFDARLRALEPA